MGYATVRAISAPELTLLRSGNQWSRLFLAIFKPNTIYTARLASLPSSYDRVTEISYNTGSGTLANVRSGMTLYVGSAAGLYDIGFARIRKAPTSNIFYIGEESEINWQSNCYLTVVDEFDLWAKHINTVDDSTFYMDHDVAYSNQNTVFDPVPIMGSHRVLKLTGATVATQFDFSNSYVIDSSISAYSVACPNSASITSGTTATPTIAFNAPGWYPVYLTVTAANGKSFTGVRYVYVYSDSSLPSIVFQLGSCSVEYDSGGWSFEVTVQDGVAIADVPERTLCILFAEDFYGNEQVSIGQLAGSENILCVGKIAEERISINPIQSEATLRIQGMQYWFSQIYAFPTGVLAVSGTPANWAEMTSPTVDKVAFRLLHWGSTATAIMDVYRTGDTRYAAELTSPASNLWAQLEELAIATIHARPGVDHYGRMFIEVEPQLVPAANRTYPTVMTIEKDDWHENVTIERIVVSPTGMIDASGVVVESGGTDGDSIFSLSPGHVFKRYGGIEVVDRLLLSSQALTNQMAGLFLGWKNNPYPSNEFKLAANNRMIDCFPRQRIAWSILASDTPRVFTLSGYFIPRRVEFSWDSETGFLQTSVTLELESVENLSMDGDIPGDGSADLSDPPSPGAFPPLPPFPIISYQDIVESEITTVILHDEVAGFIYTTKFNEFPVQWLTMNSGLTLQQKQRANFLLMGSTGILYGGYSKKEDAGQDTTYIARTTGAGGAWVVQTLPSPVNVVRAVAINPTVADQILFWAFTLTQPFNNESNHRLYIGANNSFTAGALFSNFGSGGNHPSMLSYGMGQWLATQFGRYRRISANGLSIVADAGYVELNPGHLRAGVTGITFGVGHDEDVWKGENNLATFTEVSVSPNMNLFPVLTPTNADVDETGVRLMGQGAATWTKYRSSDAGSTWMEIPGLIPGPWRFHNVKGTLDKWIAARNEVKFTENFGESFTDKTGNLNSVVAGTPLIDMIKVVG